MTHTEYFSLVINKIITNPFFKFLTVEDKEHVVVSEYLKQHYPDVIAFHVPNEGRKTPFERFKASIMGIKKGIPDFVILYPKYTNKVDSAGVKYRELESHALLIELKAPEHTRIVQKGKDAGKAVKAKGKLSPEQKEILQKLTNLKYRAVCAEGAEQAILEINKYFS